MEERNGLHSLLKASEEKIAKLMDQITVNMSSSSYCFVPFLILVLFLKGSR
jgi:hypothetical protein